MRLGSVATLILSIKWEAVKSEAQACDWISEMLSEHREFDGPIVDWSYLKLAGQLLSPTYNNDGPFYSAVVQILFSLPPSAADSFISDNFSMNKELDHISYFKIGGYICHPTDKYFGEPADYEEGEFTR